MLRSLFCGLWFFSLLGCGGGGSSPLPTNPVPAPDPQPPSSRLTISSVSGADSPFVTIVGGSESLQGQVRLKLGVNEYLLTPESDGDWQWQPTQCQQALVEGDYQIDVSATDTSGSTLEASKRFSVSYAHDYLKVHYYRGNQDYDGWGLHLWGDAVAQTAQTSWSQARSYDCLQEGWVQFWVPLQRQDTIFNFIVHRGDTKNTPDDLSLLPATFGSDVFVVQGDPTLYASLDEAQLAIESVGNASQRLDLSPVEVINTDSSLADGWANSAAFMEIYVRGFQDSDGDGHGDLQGLIQRLPYLADLGIRGLWLMPVTESSDNDHGYAVTDYRDIEDDYGDLSDFQTLLNETHQLGMGIIIDYVINHSSSANPLFLDASYSADNDKRDWYNFASSDLGWGPWGNGWRLSSSGDYYYSPFSTMMPDFNLRNPEVVQFHLNNLRFWLNMGVDGFRFDAVGLLFESADGSVTINHPDNHPLLALAQQEINRYQNRYLVCEAPDGPSLYASQTSCGRAFAFGVQQGILQSVIQGKLRSELISFYNDPQRDRMPLILSNHDHFAGDRPMSFMLSQAGIDSQNVTGYLKAAAAIYLLSSTTPFTYYGEEVGQTGAGDDWALRRPMSWTDDNQTAGFTTGVPFRPPVDNVSTNNVLLMQADSESLLSHYESLYKVRKDYPVLSEGALTLLSQVNDSVLLLARGAAAGQAIVAVNVTNQDQSVVVSSVNAETLTDVLKANEVSLSAIDAGQLSLSLPPHGSAVLVSQ